MYDEIATRSDKTAPPKVIKRDRQTAGQLRALPSKMTRPQPRTPDYNTHTTASASKYHVESTFGSNSLVENPLPRYANRFLFVPAAS